MTSVGIFPHCQLCNCVQVWLNLGNKRWSEKMPLLKLAQNRHFKDHLIIAGLVVCLIKDCNRKHVNGTPSTIKSLNCYYPILLA